MIRPEEVFKIGKMGRPHGLKGEIDLHFTDDVFDRVDADYIVCSIDGLLVPFFMEEWRFRGQDTAIMKFEDLDTEEAVRILQNADVYFPKALVNDGQQELTSWKMLTGFSVADSATGPIGTVANVDESSANILLEITSPSGEDILLPIHPDLVADISIQKRALTLNLPEGLLTLN